MQRLFITYREEFGLRLIQEAVGHRAKSVIRPLMEPVDAGAVDDGRELASTHSEGGANRREAQHHFELSSHTVNEEGPAVLLGVLDSSTLHFVADSIDDILQLIISKQVWDLSRRKQVVDHNQKLLIWHLGIGEEEHNAHVLEPRLDVELGQVSLNRGKQKDVLAVTMETPRLETPWYQSLRREHRRCSVGTVEWERGGKRKEKGCRSWGLNMWCAAQVAKTLPFR